MLIIRRLNFIDIASDIGTLIQWPTDAQCAPDGHLLRVTIPDAVSVQFNLLMMSIECSKHAENHNKLTAK